MSIFGLLGNVFDIVKAPIEVVVDLAEAVTTPIAEAANAIVDEVKDLTE
jgi:hypothetical protein